MTGGPLLDLTLQPESLRIQFWKEHWSAWGETAALEILPLAPLWGETIALDAGEPTLRWLKQHWQEWTKNCQGVLVGEDFNEIIMNALPSVPKRIVDVRKIDILAKDDRKKWLPECLLRESLHEMIVGRTPHLDCSQIAYVTGLGLEMRVAMAAVVQLGFPIVNLVVMDPEAGAKALQELQRIYFSVQFNLLENVDLTMQKNNGSLLINAATDDPGSELIRDLSYLNFVLAEGLVIDLNTLPLKNQMIEEAKNVGLPVLQGFEVQGYRDYLILKQFFPELKIPFDAYKADWLKCLESQPASEPLVQEP